MKLLFIRPLLAMLAGIHPPSFGGIKLFALAWAGACFLTLVISFVCHLRLLGWVAIVASLVPLLLTLAVVAARAIL